VPAAVYYARPLHRQMAYERYPLASPSLMVADRLAATVLSLPMHPYLAAEDQFYISEALRSSD
jgi:dTDP-4-amino-4,6-dideoxygalactose transaminase